MIRTPSLLVSGIISISFYILLCLVVYFLILKPEPKKYSFKNNQTIIELDMIVEKSDKKRIERKAEVKRDKLEDKFIKKETSRTNEATKNIKSLFGKVKTKETKIQKNQINNVKTTQAVKRYKSNFEKQKKSSNVKLDKFLNDKITTRNTDITNVNKTNNNESDEYFGKINSLLSAWTPPVQVREILRSKVLVIIYNDGSFDYKFLQLSNDFDFDSSLKAFLDEQKSIIYPKPQNSNKIQIEVNFSSEG